MQSGTVIDPSTATAFERTAAIVSSRTCRAFRALRDDDRNGHDDGDDLSRT